MICPSCKKPTKRLADNLVYQAFGCEDKECGCWIYLPKPRQATGPDTGKLVNLGAIALSVVNEENTK
jgi:hypothetical protein